MKPAPVRPTILHRGDPKFIQRVLSFSNAPLRDEEVAILAKGRKLKAAFATRSERGLAKVVQSPFVGVAMETAFVDAQDLGG